MAKLSDIRGHIVQPAEPVNTEPVDDYEEDDTEVEMDDFWEAIDLMETSRKILQGILNRCRAIDLIQRQRAQNHCDDLKQFLDYFPPVVVEAKDESSTAS